MNLFIQFDRWLFEKINGEWTNALFDLIFPFLTDLNKQKWLPIVAVGLCLIWIAVQRTRALVWIIALACALAGSDFVSYRVIKSTVERDRPEQAGLQVMLRTSHHSGSSFPSNHAANAFAGASILSLAFPPATPAFYAVAVLIAYSRVYVGVHFPLDVLGGAALGWMIAFIVRVLLAELIRHGELIEINRQERRGDRESKSRRKELLKIEKEKRR